MPTPSLADSGSINLSASDCVNGIFKRRLGHRELIAVRRDAGMEAFNWSNFLVLFLAALRCERSCSCTAEGMSFGCSSVVLKLQLHLHGATLSCCLPLHAEPSSPGPEALTRPYLEELRRFFLTAMTAESQCCGNGGRSVEELVKAPSIVPSYSVPTLDASPVSEQASLVPTQGRST